MPCSANCLLYLAASARELLFEPLRPGQIDAADSGAVHLVGVGGADAALGRADFFRAGAGFLQRVGALVIFENQLGAVRQADVVDREALGGDALHLFDQAEHVDDEAVADDVDDVRTEDSGGNQVQHIVLVADFDGVPRVVAALEADHHIHIARQNVDELAFPFVAPLGSDQNVNRHIFPRIKVWLSCENKENNIAPFAVISNRMRRFRDDFSGFRGI